MTPPFRRVLIANRGEIATRIMRTCQDLGIETVAVYSDADAGAPWVRNADASVRLGPAPATSSYLRADLIVDAALRTGADAVHPGYGFLSERASFARDVETAGLVFVGPRADAVEALGDKLAARRTAAAAGVPVVPGSMDALPLDRPADLDRVIDEAEQLGFPLLVKAAAGGGGRGMRRLISSNDLPAALAAGSAEAAASFGDGRVYLEREIRPVRHVEVQLLGDVQGRVVALGERDCSVQRRHQKLVEEAPAPGIDPELRRTLHATAVAAATAAGLTNAATAEFLFDPDGQFWFLEVNARLQVEHGVTELVTGLDLVREQLFLAAGHPLSDAVVLAAQAATDPRRHAIEVRISAEDPGRDFAPSPGTVGRWVMPAGPGIRVDSAIEPGARVAPDYDPLVAKLMVDDADRPAAIGRLRRALAEVVITGIQTTLPFHLGLARDPEFLAGNVSTDWVAERWDGPANRAARGTQAARIAARVVSAGVPTGTRHVSLRNDTGDGWARAAREDAVDRWPG